MLDIWKEMLQTSQEEWHKNVINDFLPTLHTKKPHFANSRMFIF